MRKHSLTALLSLFGMILLGITPACHQGGKLEVRAVPHQAYVFLDGYPMGDTMRTDGMRIVLRNLSPGEHTVGIYNYGYQPDVQKVTITDGKTTRIKVHLTPAGGAVSGPWGRIQIEGTGHAAVFLNGTTPGYFVGDSDEFNNDIGWKQELIVPPGTHQLTLMRGGTTVWSGPVTVAANQRVIVDVGKGGAIVNRDWPRGKKLSNLPRFRAGIASATVAVAPVTGQLAASSSQIGCGGSSQLTWSSDGAAKDEISGVGEVAASGQQTVQPKQTTTYKLTASGPGGTATQETTVNVNSSVQSSLNISPAEIRYHKVGDKVQEQGSATLAWTSTGADSISLDPIGSVDASGNRTLQGTPKKTTDGPVDETVTYTLRSANACGASDTKTASLHITGMIEPLQSAANVTETALEVKLSLNSIYFPTNLPTKAAPLGGLVDSQQRRLRDLVGNFKQYLGFRPEAHLILQAHADKRGTSAFNQVLSERRAERVRSFLVEQGVSAGQIETKSFGKEQNLDAAQVRTLTEQNPNLSPEDRQRVLHDLATFLLANNRRVDVVLSTTGQASLRYFPLDSEDLRVLIGPPPVKAKAPARKPAAKAPAKKTTK
jgi:outer membrane protein OmpA-like peptidoglycan-associated protein